MSSDELDTRTRILEATWRLLEQRRGLGVRMSDIAKATGVSRQAVYDHFGSRTELMTATADYVDEVKGLNESLEAFRAAATGLELLETCVEVWGNHIPQIYGLAKALLSTRDTDEATAAVWNNRMSGLRNACRRVIEALERDGMLAPQWSAGTATEMFWTILSVHNWEQLTLDCGWPNDKYIEHMKMLLKRTFVVEAEAKT